MQPKPFLIIGLPRSRTAWLSVFFTQYASRCYHEKIQEYPNVSEMIEAFEASPMCCGDSDSALCLKPDEVIQNADRVNIALVMRDPDDCLVSYRKFLAGMDFDPAPIMERCRAGLELIAKNCEVHTVSFDDLNDLGSMAQLQDFIMPGAPFPHSWYSQLNKLRVTQIIERAK